MWAGSGTSSADATIGFFSGRGFHDYFTAGNSIPNNATLTAETSPAGDILLSTKGFVAGDNYTIIIESKINKELKRRWRKHETNNRNNRRYRSIN